MKIQSKFNEGDSVWGASVDYVDSTIACPDCLGTLKWVVVFADGEAVDVGCQTCRVGYEPAVGRITYKKFKPSVRALIIGKIRCYDSEFSYMCVETGIESGQIHYEKDLFLVKEEAEKRAQEQYQEQMKRIAQNNFSKKFGGTKEIEEALSLWGFIRKERLEKVQKFRVWAELSGIVKKK